MRGWPGPAVAVKIRPPRRRRPAPSGAAGTPYRAAGQPQTSSEAPWEWMRQHLRSRCARIRLLPRCRCPSGTARPGSTGECRIDHSRSQSVSAAGECVELMAARHTTRLLRSSARTPPTSLAVPARTAVGGELVVDSGPAHASDLLLRGQATPAIGADRLRMLCAPKDPLLDPIDSPRPAHRR